MMAARMLMTCKATFENMLIRELGLYGWKADTSGAGWVLATVKGPYPDICFAESAGEDPVEITASSANKLTSELVDLFMAGLKDNRVDNPWPFVFNAVGQDASLSKRAKTVQAAWLKKLQKILPRVMRLAREDMTEECAARRGFFVHVTDFTRAFVSRSAKFGGQRRMQMDSKAPSRSYLKIEEAYGILGCQPGKGETVIDLGAAPGGWSYSALKRNARVIAVDNGRLLGTVKNHPGLTHHQENAMAYQPPAGVTCDWLFCDVLDQPDRILNVIFKWVGNRWCRRFIVNLKFGRTDPIPLLAKARDPGTGLAAGCSVLKIRHLYHDREELTLMGSVRT